MSHQAPRDEEEEDGLPAGGTNRPVGLSALLRAACSNLPDRADEASRPAQQQQQQQQPQQYYQQPQGGGRGGGGGSPRRARASSSNAASAAAAAASSSAPVGDTRQHQYDVDDEEEEDDEEEYEEEKDEEDRSTAAAAAASERMLLSNGSPSSTGRGRRPMLHMHGHSHHPQQQQQVQPMAPDVTYPNPKNFAERLMCVMQSRIGTDCLWWIGDGKAIALHVKRMKKGTMLRTYFRIIQYSGFIRNCNRWGFRRVSHYPTPDGVVTYQNSLFQRDRPHLVKHMRMDSDVQDVFERHQTTESPEALTAHGKKGTAVKPKGRNRPTKMMTMRNHQQPQPPKQQPLNNTHKSNTSHSKNHKHNKRTASDQVPSFRQPHNSSHPQHHASGVWGSGDAEPSMQQQQLQQQHVPTFDFLNSLLQQSSQQQQQPQQQQQQLQYSSSDQISSSSVNSTSTSSSDEILRLILELCKIYLNNSKNSNNNKTQNLDPQNASLVSILQLAILVGNQQLECATSGAGAPSPVPAPPASAAAAAATQQQQHHQQRRAGTSSSGSSIHRPQQQQHQQPSTTTVNQSLLDAMLVPGGGGIGGGGSSSGGSLDCIPSTESLIQQVQSLLQQPAQQPQPESHRWAPVPPTSTSGGFSSLVEPPAAPVHQQQHQPHPVVSQDPNRGSGNGSSGPPLDIQELFRTMLRQQQQAPGGLG